MTRPTLLVCILLLVGCGDRSAPITGKVMLRYHPPTGAVYHYAVEQRNTVNMESGLLAGAGGGAQQLTTRLHFTQAITGPVAGGIQVRITFDSTHVEAPGMAPDIVGRDVGRVPGLRSTMLLDERQHIVRAGFDTVPGAQPPPALAYQLAAGVKAMSFTLPEEPVGPGDSWTIATELPIGEFPGVSGAGLSRTTLTVREFSVAGGDTTVLLAVATTFPADPIRLNFAGQPATLHLSGSLSGDQLFSLTRGAVVRGAMKGTMRIKVTGGLLGGQGMTLSGATETTARLQ